MYKSWVKKNLCKVNDVPLQKKKGETKLIASGNWRTLDLWLFKRRGWNTQLEK